MCNLYSLTKGQKAIRDLANAMVDRAGNMPSLPAIFPNGKPLSCGRCDPANASF